jgi:choline-glycine betaine transporter
VARKILFVTTDQQRYDGVGCNGGGDALGALQAAAITVGLPFTLVLLVMCVGVYMGLSHEWRFVQGPKALAA